MCVLIRLCVGLKLMSVCFIIILVVRSSFLWWCLNMCFLC